jgi:hypothetical protein
MVIMTIIFREVAAKGALDAASAVKLNAVARVVEVRHLCSIGRSAPLYGAGVLLLALGAASGTFTRPVVAVLTAYAAVAPASPLGRWLRDAAWYLLHTSLMRAQQGFGTGMFIGLVASVVLGSGVLRLGLGLLLIALGMLLSKRFGARSQGVNVVAIFAAAALLSFLVDGALEPEFAFADDGGYDECRAAGGGLIQCIVEHISAKGSGGRAPVGAPSAAAAGGALPWWPERYAYELPPPVRILGPREPSGPSISNVGGVGPPPVTLHPRPRGPHRSIPSRTCQNHTSIPTDVYRLSWTGYNASKRNMKGDNGV